MRHVRSPTLMTLVEGFFRHYLVQTRGASEHTLRAYGMTLRLWFVFLASRRRCPVAALTTEAIDVDGVLAFLTHLEEARANGATTRNARLAAIRSLARYLVEHDLTRASQYQRILSVPDKRTPTAAAHYLEPEDVKHLLTQPDRTTLAGQRDHALLLTLYNTGARISEALNIRLEHLSLTSPRHVRLNGKGGKERLCPLWPETATTLSQLPTIRSDDRDAWVFVNRSGERLTRDGAAYLLRKYARLAGRSSNVFRRSISPHVLRHSCAVALLQAGVDVTVIRDYLGHASIATTNRYVATNLKMKREALNAFWDHAGLSRRPSTPWRPAADLLAFLASV